MTIPRELHDRWLGNVAVMTNRLVAHVRDTLLELLRDEQELGATPGSIATWHTWSQTRTLHAHIHALVSGGGLTHAGRGVAGRNGFLLVSRVVMAFFRGKRLAAIRRAFSQGPLPLPAGMRPQPCANLLHTLGRQTWKVDLQERSPHGQGGLPYRARALPGGPFATQRLVSCAAGEVTCRWRVNGEGADRPRSGLMTLPVEGVIRRYGRHVPIPGNRVVRASGLYAPTKGKALAGCREQVGQGDVRPPVALDGQTAGHQPGTEPPDRCPGCGQRLVCLGLMPRRRSPPPVPAPAEVAA